MSAQQNVLTKADKKRLRQLKMNKLIAEIQERWLPYSNRLEELYAFRCNREGVKYFFDSPDQAKSIGAFNFNEELCALWKNRVDQLRHDKVPMPKWMAEEEELSSQRNKLTILNNL